MKSEIEIEYEQWLSRLDFMLRQPPARGGPFWYAYNMKPGDFDYETFERLALRAGIFLTPYTVFVYSSVLSAICPDFRSDDNGNTWVKAP
jgi:hypothetical protein